MFGQLKGTGGAYGPYNPGEDALAGLIIRTLNDYHLRH
jgi:hypothetical protein